MAAAPLPDSGVWKNNQDRPKWEDMEPVSAFHVAAGMECRQTPQVIGLSHRISPYEIHKVFEVPWQTYEPIVGISLGRHMCLARRRNKKTEFVNIQQLVKASEQVKPLVESMSQYSHPSFLSLLECYYHNDDAFLVWEPVEISVNQILASKCPITEAEIVAIVKPVLEGIRYLCGRGKALAALTVDSILLTPSGQVKIANVEHSCEITAPEMDAASMKLFSLADIVERLMKKNPPPFPWSDAMRELPRVLRSLDAEQLAYSMYLQRPVANGELKALVSIANKTACHRVEFVDRAEQG